MQLTELKKQLEARLAEINSKRVNREDLRIEPQPEVMDNLDNITSVMAAVGSLEARSAEAKAIRATLQRIAEGTYGECQDCEEPIAPARLKAVPHALRCIACQNQYDTRGRDVRSRDDDELEEDVA